MFDSSHAEALNSAKTIPQNGGIVAGTVEIEPKNDKNGEPYYSIKYNVTVPGFGDTSMFHPGFLRPIRVVPAGTDAKKANAIRLGNGELLSWLSSIGITKADTQDVLESRAVIVLDPAKLSAKEAHELAKAREKLGAEPRVIGVTGRAVYVVYATPAEIGGSYMQCVMAHVNKKVLDAELARAGGVGPLAALRKVQGVSATKTRRAPVQGPQDDGLGGDSTQDDTSII